MIKKIILILFLSVFAFAEYAIIPFTTNAVFNYFASWYLWMIIISLPFIAVFSIIRKKWF